jgi:RNA polymerase sigma-70 factor (ECF subfamily)
MLKDKLLLIRLQKKDPEAFAQMYDAYADSIYRFIYFKVSNRQDAEDLTSEVFIKVWQYITSGEKIRNLRALIYQSARNLVIDFYRKKSRRELSQDIETISEIPDDRQQSLLSSIEATLELDNLEVILRRMKDEYREILVLRYIEDLSITEIAEVLHKSKGSVRILLHRALKVAKELLSENDKKRD